MSAVYISAKNLACECMEILIIIVLGLWMNSGWQKTKNRVIVLEEEVSNLRATLNILKKDNSSVIGSPINIVNDPIRKTYIPTVQIPETTIQQPVSEASSPPQGSISGEEKHGIEVSTPPPKPLSQHNRYAYIRPEIIKKDDTNVDDNIDENLEIKTDNVNVQSTLTSEPFLPEWVMRSLTGGRLFVTIGLLILFIGVAMLLKYTAQYVTIPIEMRFIAVALGALGLIWFGHKQIGTRRDYGLYLHGGGLGILFLTVFVAFKSYSLLEPSTAFVLLAIIGAATFASSVKHDTMALAVLAVTGGFLAPILTSTGQGSHIALFSYYLLLNLIIFAIAWLKSWRILNSIGFAFTFIIGLVWGGKYYIPEFYPSVQTFLIAYFLLYVGIGILFASRDKPNISIPIDAASIFGVPLIGFSLQLALTKHFPDGDLFSCLALGAFYGTLSIILRNNVREGWKLLSQIFAWLSVLFFTLAIPFAFDAQTTAPLWSMEGVAMLWMMGRSKQKLYGYAGVLLIALSNIFILKIANTQGLGTTFANGFFVSTIILSVAHLLAAYFLHEKRSSLEDTGSLAKIFSGIGMLWWFGVWGKEIDDWHRLTTIPTSPLVAWLVFYSISALAAMLIHARFAIALFDKLIELVLPAIIVFSIAKILSTTQDYHPLMNYGYIAYITAFATHYFWLWKNHGQTQPWHHILAYITLVLLCGLELGYYTHIFEPTVAGKTSGWLLATILGIVLLLLPQRYRKFPLTVLSEKYQYMAGFPLIALATVLCAASFTSITMLFGHYIPLLNLSDITELLTILAFIAFYRHANVDDEIKNNVATLNGGLVFLFINALMLRFISNNMGLTYLSPAMFDSVIVQTSMTILWTLIAMAAMLTSSKRESRNSWFIGAALLGIVILKLFFIDLANTGTLSRIVSFMGVGGLTMLLGYFSPIPPKKEVEN